MHSPLKYVHSNIYCKANARGKSLRDNSNRTSENTEKLGDSKKYIFLHFSKHIQRQIDKYIISEVQLEVDTLNVIRII